MNVKKILLSIIIVSLIFASVPSFALGEKETFEILIKYKSEKTLISKQGLYSSQAINDIEQIKVKKIKVNTKEEYLELLNKCKADPNIEYAEANIKYSKMQITNDNYTSDDWGIQNINAYASWDLTVGTSDTIIAVIDTGVDLDHPDLLDQLIEGRDFVNNDMVPDDDEGHGTLVAEIIGSKANNSYGKAGVSWNSKIMPLKVLDDNGDGYSDDIAEAIIYAADNDARIINLSLGGPEDSNVIQDAVQYAYNKGVLIVAASGNTSSHVCYPGAFEEVMAIGAIDEDEEIAYFSGRGSQISMVAPGVDIIGGLEGETILESGTSFSTPFVSGAAALVWSICPDLTNIQIRDILQSTTKDLGEVGFDETYGYGNLDVYKAIRSSIEYLYNDTNSGYGDFNQNNIIDIYDIVKMSKLINTSYESDNYSDLYDINNDKIIDLLDLNIQSLNYGKRY